MVNNTTTKRLLEELKERQERLNKYRNDMAYFNYNGDFERYLESFNQWTNELDLINELKLELALSSN